ncbi:MAG: hypothetical protein LUC32_04160 [Clostridiales bacterium]|nr:hypothetical protein [Clostridiales bacterium]
MDQEKNQPKKKNVWTLFKPCAVPVAALIFIFVQLVFFPTADTLVTFTLLFLVMSFLAVVFSLRQGFGVEGLAYMAGAWVVAVIALIYFVSCMGIPSPMEDPTGFFKSVGGVWIAVLAVEALITYAVYDFHKFPESNRFADNPSGRGVSGSAQEEGSHSDSVAGGDNERDSATANRDEKTRLSMGMRIYIVIFIVLAAVAPSLTFTGMDRWIANADSIVSIIFGLDENSSDLLIVLSYCVVMTALLFALPLLKNFVVAIMTLIDGRNSDFLGEYGASMALFIAIIVVVIMIRSKTVQDVFTGFEGVVILTPWLTMILTVVIYSVGFAILLETIRLILEQCFVAGSLLKTLMHLIFIQIVHFAYELLMGLLSVLALRDAIESLFFFFLPNRDDSITDKRDAAEKQAMEKELDYVLYMSEFHWKERMNRERESGAGRGKNGRYKGHGSRSGTAGSGNYGRK